jgi:23S rRNA (adenine2503-C2)-methyltransferase
LRAKINLIPFNRHPRLPYEPPPAARTLAFQDILREANYTVMIRESRGQEINAACGQLAGEKSGQPTG